LCHVSNFTDEEEDLNKLSVGSWRKSLIDVTLSKMMAGREGNDSFCT
jgi:hypothetical protein